jgi:hypothetical protein
VETFVEVKVIDLKTRKEMTMKTNLSEGQYPEWNEVLEFSLKAKNKIAFTKEELE